MAGNSNVNFNMDKKTYCVYILASVSKRLYVGVTGDLYERIWQHKQEVVPSFSKKYHIKKLVYYEITSDVYSALGREKKIKKWRREKNIQLIESVNPEWKDLSFEI